MKTPAFISLLRLLIIVVMVGGVSPAAYGNNVVDITTTIAASLDQSRANIWQTATRRGIEPTMLRHGVGSARATEFDQRLWPLQRNATLDGLAQSLNQQNLKAGEFSRLLSASNNPSPIAEKAGYLAAEIDILYAVTAYPNLTDATEAGLQLWNLIIDEELSRLIKGEQSLLFASTTADVGIALSGQQLFFDGSPYYTYILTVIVARPQMPYPVNADTFLTDGQYLGQPGLPVFSARYYLEANPDLLTALGNNYQAALNHWQKFGIYEGRQGSPVFNAHYYLEANPDIKARLGNDYQAATAHWLRYGIHEGRASAPGFDARRYLLAYPDLGKAFGQNYQAATWHYLTWGLVEGR